LDPLSLELEFTIALALWTCLGTWRMERGSPGRACLAGVCLAGIAWCAGELAFLRDLLPEATADRIKYFGVLSLPSLWLSLAATSAQLKFARRIPWFPVVLLTPQICLYSFLFSDLLGGLILTTIECGPDLYGQLWWVHNIYGNLTAAIGSGIFLQQARRRHGSPGWSRDLALGLTPLAPMAANAVFTALGRSWEIDPTPLFFAIALLPLHALASAGAPRRGLTMGGRSPASSPTG